MIPIEVQNVIRSLPARVLELRLLRGSIPWSLAGTDGTRRDDNILTRELLVSRINTVARPFGWSARLDMVRSEAGRTNKIELVLSGPSGESEVWTW
jgi:hypothetical protein